MQKLILPLLFALPLSLMAQSKTANQINHEQAVKALLESHPNAKIVDIEQLKRDQKDLHKTCNTCKRSAAKTSSTSGGNQLSLAELKANKARLENLLNSADANNQGLINKYKQALASTEQQIRLAQTRIHRDNKLK